MAKVKGVALMSRVSTIKDSFGEDALKSVLDAMKPQNRDMLTNVIASSWYDGDIFVDFNKSIKRVLSSKSPNIMEKVGELTAETSLKGIHSSRLKTGEVKQTMIRAGSLWKAFHDTGELEVTISPDTNQVIISVKGYETPHPENCQNLIGWGREMIVLSGGKNVVVKEVKCACKGDGFCEMIATWD